MRLAFAIPYAGGSREYLRCAIESVRAQSITDWTLEIVDDSRRPENLAPFLATFQDARISYRVHGEPHGIGFGWNACLETHASSFLTILHADDELEATYAREMIALADRHPGAALYYCAAAIVDANGKRMFSLRDRFKAFVAPGGDEPVSQGASAIARFCNGNFVMAPTLMYRREAIAGRSFSTEHRFTLDLDFLLRTLFAGDAIVGTTKTLFRYRRHGLQETAILGRDTARMNEEIAFYDGLAHRFETAGDIRLARLARLRLSVRLGGVAAALGDLRCGNLAGSAAKLKRSITP